MAKISKLRRAFRKLCQTFFRLLPHPVHRYLPFFCKKAMTAPYPIKNPILGFNPFDVYAKSPGLNLGEAELFVGGSSRQVLGRSAAFLLVSASTASGKSPFKGVTFICPPLAVMKHTDDDLLNIILDGLRDIRIEPVSEAEAIHMRRLLSIVRCTRLDADQVVEAVARAGQNQICLIASADLYRDKSIKDTSRRGQTSVVILEDQWVPHVVKLAEACLASAKKTDCYLVFESAQTAPTRKENAEKLAAVDSLYPVYILSSHDSANNLVQTNAARWVGQSMAGMLEDVLAEVASVELEERIKKQLVIQILNRSGHEERAAREIRRAFEGSADTWEPDMAARFGRIAERGGDAAIASQLFERSLDEVSDQPVLEGILMSSSAMGKVDLVDRSFERLANLFPDSELVTVNRESRLMRRCQRVVIENNEEIDSTAGFSDAELFISNSLSLQNGSDYESILREVTVRWPEAKELAEICCAINAQSSDRSGEALSYALTSCGVKRYQFHAVRVLMALLRSWMLQEEIQPGKIEILKLPILRVVEYLAEHPKDSQTRAALNRLLAVESCGAIGLPIIASLALDIAGQGAEIAATQEAQITEVDLDEFKAFFEAALVWLSAQPVVEPGVTVIPIELCVSKPAGLILFMNKILRTGANQRGEDVDLKFLEQCAQLICGLVPHVPGETADIEAYRLLAGKQWLSGNPQKSRNSAEQILILSGESANRQRLAWASFADIYQRTGNRIDALIGVCCAMASKSEVGLSELWHETFTLLRITRDIGLIDVSKALLDTCRKLYEMLDLDDGPDDRLETIALSIRLADIKNAGSDVLEQLLKDVTAHCLKVLNNADELFPAATLLGQTTALCEAAQIDIDNHTRETLASVYKQLGPDVEAFLRSVSAANPSAADLQLLHNRLDAATNSEDVASDLTTVVLASRRLLGTSDASPTVLDAAMALELLAEHSIEPLEPPRKVEPEWAGEFAKGLSTNGIAVVLLGLAQGGELVSVVAEEGALKLGRGAAATPTFRQVLDSWSGEYPYRYGFIERKEGNNEFYLTMEEFDVPLPIAKSIVVICEPALQQIPVNLVLQGGQFVGLTSAIGVSPSLTWLDAARRNPAKHDGRRMAWISASQDPENVKTLEFLLARLEAPFNEFGFVTDTGRRIPKGLGGAQMVVVTAHGGLTSENRYIHKISDEGELAESPLTLARALAGVEIVILFVCSGGRIDAHPLGNTTVGLPKMLLDRGCRAVIASPWPLAAEVPGRWLEGFLPAWESGQTIIECTHVANNAVAKGLGDQPQYSLALTVYGDVLLKNDGKTN